ncbi:MAG TPA: hypothetical protein VLG72_08965, partial [Nitrospirota bacterium]|nr:hypothetical protein [Nitrospirota bacterium]
DALIKLEKRKRFRPKTVFRRDPENDRVTSVNLWLEGIPLEWRMIGAIAGMMLVFGVLFLSIANQLMGRALRSQIDQRAFVMATNLSDAAAGNVIGNNVLELHALVTKYARLEGAAYAFIEDSKGKIIAHSLALFPPELAEVIRLDERRHFHRRTITLQGRTVYETRTPILEGQLGAAHVGLWGEHVDREIYRALLPIVGILAGLLLAATVLVALLAPHIIRWLADIEIKTASLETSETTFENRLIE